MRLTAMDIAFKYTAGKINVEQSYHIEFDLGEKVDMTKWIFDKATALEQAGAEPAVVKKHTELGSATARANGAKGYHPDESNWVFTSTGEIEKCPKCKLPLIWKDGTFNTGPRKGKPYRAKMHEVKSQTCDFVDWGD